MEPYSFSNNCTMVLFSIRIDLNCLIKVADFGLSEHLYTKNYFKQGSSGEAVKLPVKWMSLEGLTDGYFSEKSDVVINN